MLIFSTIRKQIANADAAAYFKKRGVVFIIFFAGILILLVKLSASQIPHVPGFDFDDSYRSASNFFISKTSYHDPFLDAPIYKGNNSERDLFSYIHEFYSFHKRMGVSTNQVHPVLGSWYYYPFIFFPKESAAVYYAYFQLALFWCIFLILWGTGFNSFSKGMHCFIIALGITQIVGSRYIYTPLNCNLNWGQTNLLVVSFTLLSLFLICKSRPVTGGFFLALATADKVIPLLLFLAVPKRHRVKMIMVFVATLLLMVLILFIMVDEQVFKDLLIYPLILIHSNYNPITSESLILMGHGNSAGMRFVPEQIQTLLHTPFNKFLMVCFSLISLIFYKARGFITWRSTILWMILNAGLIGYPTSLRIVAISLSIWAICALYCNAKYNQNPDNIIIGYVIIMTALFPTFLKTFWDHHLIFIYVSLFLLLICAQKSKNSSSLILASLGLICLLFSQAGIHSETLRITTACNSPLVIRFSAIGYWLGVLSIESYILRLPKV